LPQLDGKILPQAAGGGAARGGRASVAAWEICASASLSGCGVVRAVHLHSLYFPRALRLCDVLPPAQQSGDARKSLGALRRRF